MDDFFKKHPEARKNLLKQKNTREEREGRYGKNLKYVERNEELKKKMARNIKK